MPELRPYHPGAPVGFRRARVAGTGSYLPDKVLSNKDIEKMVETSDEWIFERTGIRTRRVAAPDQVNSDLCLIAARQALDAAGITPKDIDAILVATVSPDQTIPTTACFLQKKLGARDCMAVDVAAACTGFLYALAMANDFIACGSYKNILVVGSEILTRYVNYKDRDTCILFGDGAGAVVLQAARDNEESRIYSHHLHADGSIADLFEMPTGGYMHMKGREVFKQAIRTMSQCCKEALDHNKMNGNDVDWVIPHQANVRIIEGVAKLFGIAMDKVVIEIENMGNTSAATVPVALDRAVRDGRIQRGQNLLLTAFGAGITSGALLMRY